MMDNLSSHKVQGVRERIRAMGADLLCRPPYSPDLNPIEKAWSKLKQLLRTAKAVPAKPSSGHHGAPLGYHHEKCSSLVQTKTRRLYTYERNALAIRRRRIVSPTKRVPCPRPLLFVSWGPRLPPS